MERNIHLWMVVYRKNAKDESRPQPLFPRSPSGLTGVLPPLDK